MGVRGEIFSTRMVCEGRTYFFNVKENRTGDLFLAIVESKPDESGTSFDRRSIVVFKESLQDFLKAFEKSLEAMEKAQGSKPARRSPAKRPPESEQGKPRRADGPGSKGEVFSLLPEAEGKPKRRVLRTSAKVPIGAPSPEIAPAKPSGKRLTVKKARPRDE
jgi:hypothetical protein